MIFIFFVSHNKYLSASGKIIILHQVYTDYCALLKHNGELFKCKF
jgi:hypothetical protein